MSDINVAVLTPISDTLRATGQTPMPDRDTIPFGKRKPQLSPSEAVAIENDIKDLVSKIKSGATDSDVATRVGAHTKAIIDQNTEIAIKSITELEGVLKEQKALLSSSRSRVCEEIERHVTMSNAAADAAKIIQRNVMDWRKNLGV